MFPDVNGDGFMCRSAADLLQVWLIPHHDIHISHPPFEGFWLFKRLEYEWK